MSMRMEVLVVTEAERRRVGLAAIWWLREYKPVVRQRLVFIRTYVCDGLDVDAGSWSRGCPRRTLWNDPPAPESFEGVCWLT